MKFQKYYEEKKQPQWKNHYIDYQSLMKILKKLKKFRKKATVVLMDEIISSITLQEQIMITQIKFNFEEQILEQVKKFNQFFKFQFEEGFKIKFFKIIINIDLVHNQKCKSQKIQQEKIIKEAVERFYGEINLLKQFVILNLKSLKILIEKYTHILEDLEESNRSFINDFNEVMVNSYTILNISELNKLTSCVKRIYLASFYTYEKENKGKKHLDRILNNQHILPNEAVKLFFLIGFLCVFLFMSIFCLVDLGFFDNYYSDFIYNQFPVFRGSLLIFVYFFFCGINILLWDKFRIQYKNILQIEIYHSTVYQLFKTVFIFFILWILCFLYSAITVLDEGYSKNKFFSADIELFIPSLLFFSCITYLLIPFKIFNHTARFYALKLIKNIFLSIFSSSNFVSPWATDQFLSFIIPMRDLTYTTCYTFNVIENHTMRNHCHQQFYWSYLVIIFPLIYRFIQCLKKARSQLFQGVRIYYIKSIIYLMLIFLVGIDFLNENLAFLNIWYVFCIVSWISLHLWDILVDWGLLENKLKKARYIFHKSNLSSSTFYFVGFISSFVLRLNFILSISPNFISQNNLFGSVNKYYILIETGIGFFEMIRRGLWNFFKVEHENFNELHNFKSISGIKLPYKIQKSKQINKIIEHVYQDFVHSDNQQFTSDFLLDKFFTLDQNKMYIKNYLLKNQIKLSHSLQEELNKSVDEQSLRQFYSNYTYNLEIKIATLKIQESNMSKILDEPKDIEEEMKKSFIESLNFKTPIHSFLQEKLVNLSSQYQMSDQREQEFIKIKPSKKYYEERLLKSAPGGVQVIPESTKKFIINNQESNTKKQESVINEEEDDDSNDESKKNDFLQIISQQCIHKYNKQRIVKFQYIKFQ